MRPIARLRLALVLSALLAAGPAAAFSWTVHTDPAGTRLDLPDYFERVGPGAPDGSGALFRSEDGAAVRVFGSLNLGGVRLPEVLRAVVAQNEGAFQQVTYQQARPTWFVLSGYRDEGATIYYTRYALSEDGRAISSFEITFPTALRQTYEPIVTRMSLRFRVLPASR